MRRSAVSTVLNIVEGSARLSDREYVNFLNIALGSASEMRYLIDVSVRLRYVADADVADFEDCSRELVRSLQNLIEALRRSGARSPQPVAHRHS
jgi:four helix bundle protein